MSKKKNKININSYVSWAAAIIILALGAKILHYPWAEYLIIAGFALEFIVFVVLGFTTKSEVKSSHAPFDGEIFGRLEECLTQLSKNVENNNKITAALLNEVGVKTLAEALDKPSDIANLDVKELQNKIYNAGINFERLNHTLIELNNFYVKQVEAFKSK